MPLYVPALFTPIPRSGEKYCGGSCRYLYFLLLHKCLMLQLDHLQDNTSPIFLHLSLKQGDKYESEESKITIRSPPIISGFLCQPKPAPPNAYTRTLPHTLESKSPVPPNYNLKLLWK